MERSVGGDGEVEDVGVGLEEAAGVVEKGEEVGTTEEGG